MKRPDDWTILKLLQWTTTYFKEHDIESARIDAELLLAFALGLERIDLYLRYDQPLNPDELTRFRTMVKRRVAREPVAYILGAKEFWTLEMAVGPEVLIPRPETECLVEFGHELVVDLVDHVQALHRGARLAAVQHSAPQCGAGCLTDVGVFEHDHGVVAPEFQHDGGEMPRCLGGDLFADDGRPGEGEHVDRSVDERRTDVCATMDHLHEVLG